MMSDAQMTPEFVAPPPAPAAARVAFWTTVTIVGLTTVGVVVVSILTGDTYWGAFAAGAFGGLLILLTWLVAACAGAIGLVHSIRRHSTRGVWMSVSPYVPILIVLAMNSPR
jgi:hypothetical protein